MSFFQIVSAFRLYKADVLLLALGVTFLTSLLKNTVMKTFDKKVFVFLPFGIGLIVFAVYRAIATASLAPIGADFTATLEGGFGCGCAATLYYIVYEHFLRGKLAVNPLLPLLEFVPEEKREEAAKALYTGAKDLPKEEMVAFFRENLNTYAEPPMSEEELSATAEILSEFLASLLKK
ncbi:MAG: hypothetical protein IKD43_02315 [Clostridia bacterium]|nr:hypothetical protein [Clostridia bacterium]